MIFARIKEIVTGIFFYLAVGPFLILYGLGFLLGPEIADRLPKWFGCWFIGAFGLLLALWMAEKVMDYLTRQRGESQNKIGNMAAIKDPDLDYHGMAERLEKKKAERGAANKNAL